MAAAALCPRSKHPTKIRRGAVANNSNCIHDCVNCLNRETNSFCKNFAHIVERHGHIGSVALYRKHTRLFGEGEEGRGVFILCSGTAKLCTSSRLGKNIITRIAEPGDLLGLGAVVSGSPYEATAELMIPSQVKFISRDSFLQLIQRNRDISWAVAQILSASYYPVFEKARAIGLTTHPIERLAKFLLSWFGLDQQHNDLPRPVHVTLPLTHQEIADSISSSREAVSRLICELRRKRLLRSRGATLSIANRPGLEALVHF